MCGQGNDVRATHRAREVLDRAGIWMSVGQRPGVLVVRRADADVVEVPHEREDAQVVQPCTPAPRTVSTLASSRASSRVETAADADVRIAVM
jgi:hypothetical protein